MLPYAFETYIQHVTLGYIIFASYCTYISRYVPFSLRFTSSRAALSVQVVLSALGTYVSLIINLKKSVRYHVSAKRDC
jgi:hypothetical protein